MVPQELMDVSEFAREEEGRAAQTLRAMAPECRDCAGGVALRGERGSWINQIVGAGLHGPVDADEVRGAVAWHEEAGIESRAELASVADPTFVRVLADLRFVVKTFEEVFVRSLRDDADAIAPPHPLREGLVVQQLDARDPVRRREFATVAYAGFLPPGVVASEEMLGLVFKNSVRDSVISLMVVDQRQGGAIVGVGAMSHEAGDSAASLYGMSVLETHRRQGIQQSLIAQRLRIARQRGARVATISSRPGVATLRNARRFGFQVAYSKAILVRPGPGLTGAAE